MYFDKVKEGQEIFGLIFGHGVVVNVLKNSHYTFEVEYDNGNKIHYTPDGIPSWHNLDFQTVYYKTDIDLFQFDFDPIEDVLSAKKIIKLRNKKQLQVKCPSGLWQDINNCASHVTERYLENNLRHLFRKRPKK